MASIPDANIDVSREETCANIGISRSRTGLGVVRQAAFGLIYFSNAPNANNQAGFANDHPPKRLPR